MGQRVGHPSYLVLPLVLLAWSFQGGGVGQVTYLGRGSPRLPGKGEGQVTYLAGEGVSHLRGGRARQVTYRGGGRGGHVADGLPPPPNRITDTSENITIPCTTYGVGKKTFSINLIHQSVYTLLHNRFTIFKLVLSSGWSHAKGKLKSYKPTK